MTSRIGSPDTPADIEVRTCLDGWPPQSFVMKAGAGSGKTTSLVKALEHLATTRGAALRRTGQRIACITYTKVAVGEIWNDVGNSPLFHVSTIHSFLWSVIQFFQNDIRAWVDGRIVEKISEKQQHHDRPRTQARTRERLLGEIARLEAERASLDQVEQFNYATGSDYAKGDLGHDDVLKLVPTCIEALPLLRRLIASRFPYIFVDESQDTNPVIVDALRKIAIEQRGICIGFFGDPMQKIYPTGAGVIALEPEWREITKPENFRCPKSVLDVVNAIRASGDGLQQIRGRMTMVDGELRPVIGSAQIFVFPADEHRTARLGDVRSWLRQATDDPRWLSDDSEDDVRLLVLVHRMAATRLGFPNIYAALHDRAPSSLSEGLDDGTAWPLRPFVQSILPIVLAERAGDHFAVMSHVRAESPALQPDRIDTEDLPTRLRSLQAAVTRLAEMLDPATEATLKEVLIHVRDEELVQLDERLRAYLEVEPADDGRGEAPNVLAFLNCNARELWGYRKYIEDESPFATQQGVKGAQFDRVLVVVDDEEGFHSHFSYGKYFGYTPLSESDEEKIAAGEESVLDRTRRLFYVCCSRASQDLAVVLFVADVEVVRAAIEALQLFPQAAIHGPEVLP